MSLPSTTERVTRHTPEEVNRAIRDRTERSIAYYRNNPDQIGQRLIELENEWDIERALEANAATVILSAGALGFLVSRKFFAVPVLAAGFLLQHALQGWCPPLPILRRLGYRTTDEIQQERDALEGISQPYH